MPLPIMSFFSIPLTGMSFFWMPLPGITESFRLHDTMHKDCRSDHIFRVDRSHGHDFFDFDNRNLRGHGHDGIEISGRQPVGEISQRIGFLRFDQCEVRMNGHFQNAAVPIDDALFFSFGNLGSGSHGSIKSVQPRSRRAHSFAQNSLRHEVQRYFPGREALLKIVRMRSGKRRNHMLDLIVLKHQAKLAFTRPAIVADGRKFLRPCPRQRLNQIVRKARAAKSPEHDLRAVGNISNGFVQARKNFFPHLTLKKVRNSPQLPAPNFAAFAICRRYLDATPLSRSQRPVSVPLKSFFNSERKSASSSTSISSRALLRKITRAPMRSASPTCFAKLPMPKCEGNNAGGIRKIAFVPRPSRDGTITTAGSWHSMASKSSISLACTRGTSSGIRSSPVTPHSSQMRDAASTESLSEFCRSSRRISQPFFSATRIAGW